MPASLVVVVTFTPVARSTRVILAPGTAELVASLTRPVMLPVSNWASSVACEKASAARRTMVMRVKLDMEPPWLVCAGSGGADNGLGRSLVREQSSTAVFRWRDVFSARLRVGLCVSHLTSPFRFETAVTQNFRERLPRGAC